MSVPDNSRPKAPPSLLADGPGKPAGAPASGSTPNGSRILANLEGRVVPPASPASKPQRSSKAAGLVALLVIGAGAFGAWHWMSRTPSSTSGVAATAASVPAVVAASAVAASHAVVASAQKSAPDEASASQAATIVADDDAAKGSDSDRLSRALTDGAASGASATVAPLAAAAQTKAVQQSQTPEKSTAKHKSAAEAKQEKQEKQEKANAHKNESKTAVAQAKAKKAPANGKRDDSDADLLAVLVARTKPADAKQGSTHGSKTAARATDANASLAQQVKACSERGFFEDQLCRWRVCDGHWGKDPACPQAAKASNEH
ncbi:hypothetical protein [Paraburkholderia bannensis]|uniref:hypothetical protein n=1 Tax=Paraburkholderia bannensis TaxID=765414 RepID=UPI00047FACA5|nr:hypothetical protein [Paraburkholderia bannensis]